MGRKAGLDNDRKPRTLRVVQLLLAPLVPNTFLPIFPS